MVALSIPGAPSDKAVETDAQGRLRLRRSVFLGRRSLLRWAAVTAEAGEGEVLRRMSSNIW